jgi:preprotein translocase subunit SecF
MELFRTPNIDFIKHRKKFYALSIGLAIFTVGALVARRGLNPGIDFAGGTLVQVSFAQPVDVGALRDSLNAAKLTGASIQTDSARTTAIIRFRLEGGRDQEALARGVTDTLKKSFPDNPVDPAKTRVDYVGPVVGKHLMVQAAWAVFFSLLGISIYVAFRFNKMVWGLAGVLALIHDVFLTVGFLSFMGREFSVTVVAALLTLAGYSINDTIVIYDRIRENMRQRRKESLDVLINRSCNETLSRTVITSFTVFLVLLSLLIFGGEVLRDFSLAMTFGVVVGSYSTIFVASAMVYDWQTKGKPASR